MTPTEEYSATRSEVKEGRKDMLKRVADNRDTHRDNYCVALLVWVIKFREYIKRRVNNEQEK